MNCDVTNFLHAAPNLGYYSNAQEFGLPLPALGGGLFHYGSFDSFHQKETEELSNIQLLMLSFPRKEIETYSHIL